MHILRTRIKKDIICEFLPPAKQRGARGGQAANKVIILCGGMPGYPGKKDLPEFLSKKGYWVFIPRYRGSWESGGAFLKISPHRDVLDVIDQLPKGFHDLWSGKIYKVSHPEIYLLGSSFGGPAVILASRDARVKKAIAFSPVIDWRVETKTEPINKLKRFAREAFGPAYRFADKDFNKLKTGKFYNPAHEADTIDGEKVFIIHAKDDEIVPAKTSKQFAKITGVRLLLLPRGRHLSISQTMDPKFWKKISGFLKK